MTDPTPTPTYAVRFSTSAEKDLTKLDGQIARRIAARIALLAADPRPHGLRALTGYPGYLRIRVGDYRVVYTVEDDVLVVLVVALGHRRDIYDHL